MMKYTFTKKELNAIVEIAKCRSFSSAAEKLQMAQANLSRTIAVIEDKLGLKIFERETRPIKITRFGMKLIKYINENLEAMERLSSFAESYKRSLSEYVNIYAPSCIIFFISRYLLQEIRILQPNLKINLFTDNSGTRLTRDGISVKDDADITFTYCDPVNELFVAKKLSIIEAGIYATPSVLKNYPVKKICDIERHPCVIIGEKCEFNTWKIYNIADKNEISLHVTGPYVADNYITATEMAMNNCGFVFAPTILVNELQSSTSSPLSSLLAADFKSSLNLYMVYKQCAYLPYRVRVLTETIGSMLTKILA